MNRCRAPQRQGETATVGILMLETTFPRIPGDIGNPASFPFPVRYRTVPGASPQNVVLEPDPDLVAGFIAAGRDLVDQGVKAIATSCGFLALFHRQLVAALAVPVFTSSLLQVHMAQALILRGQKVGILTARKPSLTHAHLAALGIEDYPLIIAGMEDAPEFSAVFIGGKEALDEARCRREMQSAARELKRRHADLGAVVLECTNMPPYAETIREEIGVPVFDAVTLVHYAHQIVGGAKRLTDTD
jgi:Asp/Glu/hydantoin racemase